LVATERDGRQIGLEHDLFWRYIIYRRTVTVQYIEDRWVVLYLLGGHCTPRIIDRSSRRGRGRGRAQARFCTKVDIILSTSCSTIMNSSGSIFAASLSCCEMTFH
jgi:hypothetical protein